MKEHVTREEIDSYYMVENILQISGPIHKISKIFGLQRVSLNNSHGVEKRLSRGASLYSLIIILSLLCTVFVGLIMNLRTYFRIINRITSIMEYLTHITHMSVLAVTVFQISIKKPYVNPKILSNFAYIDINMEIPSINREKLRSRIVLGLAMWFSYLSSMYVLDFQLWFSLDNCLQVPFYLYTLMCDIVLIQYISDLWILIYQFRVFAMRVIFINRGLLKGYKNKNVDFLVEFIPLEFVCENIKKDCKKYWLDENTKLRFMFDKLADNVDLINNIYGIQILYYFGCCLINTLACAHFMVLVLQRNILEMFCMGLWCLRYFLMVTAFTVTAQTLKNENGNLVIAINKIITLSEFTSAEERSVLTLLESQVRARPAVLSACGVFPIDTTLLQTFIGTIASYAIILIQLH